MKTQPKKRQRRTRTGAGAAPEPVKTEFIYHWNRIIGALAVLVLLIGLSGFGLHAWLSSPSAPSMDAGFDEVGAPVPRLEVASEPGGQAAGEPAPADRRAHSDEAALDGRLAETEAPPQIPATGEDAGPDLATSDAPESSTRVVQTAPGPAPEPAAPEVTTAPDAAMLPDTESPIEESGPARSEAHEAAQADASRVFLAPGTRVNLRAAPSLASPVLRILDARVEDVELQLVAAGEAFYQVRSAEGIVGWVSRDFSSLTPYAEPAR